MCAPCTSDKMNTRQSRKSIASEIQQTSQDELNDLSESSPAGNSKTGKTRAKNYSADESAALVKVCDKFHAIISTNTHTDKDKQEKQEAWRKIKSDFDQYCQTQGIPVSGSYKIVLILFYIYFFHFA